MIALPESLPLVAWHRDRNVPLSEVWVMESLDASARRAGQPGWKWSPDVARAITSYLREEFSGSVISTGDLREIMRRSLLGIGCAEIAGHVSLVAPRVTIHLPELARLSALELLFFPYLETRLREAVDVVVQGIRLEGIRECAKILGGASRWNRGCQRLSDDIVHFSRHRLHSWHNPHVDLAVF